MRKFFGKVHLWLAVPFGIILTIICLSGATLVFEEEIMEMSRPELYFVQSVGDTPISISDAVDEVNKVIPDSIRVTGIKIYSSPKRCYEVMLSKPKHASVFVDQYTGEITGKSEKAPFFMFMFKLHRWLLDGPTAKDGGMSIGRIIGGISVLMFVVILVSGIIIWIPKRYSVLKHRLKIETTKGLKRFLYDLHVSASIYVVFILLMLALTGLSWSFPWYRNGYYKLFGANLSVSKSVDVSKKGTRENVDLAVWDSAYTEILKVAPDNNQIIISDSKISVLFKHIGNQRAADTYKYDIKTGKILSMQPYKDSNPADKIRGLTYSLHTGDWGGIFSKILTFIVAIVGASLPLTGYHIWLSTVKNRRRRRKNSKTR